MSVGKGEIMIVDYGESVQRLSESALRCEHVGSRVTCNPPVMDTDDDYLLLVSDWQKFLSDAFALNFVLGGSFASEDIETALSVNKFVGMRLGKLNLIVTEDAEFFGKFMTATFMAKKLNLLDKDDRIALFQAILYDRV